MHFQTFRRRVRNEEFVNSSASTLSFRDSYSSSPELLKGKCFLESAPRRNEACVYANTAQSVISSTKEFAIFRWNTNKRQTDRRRREEERGKKGERERESESDKLRAKPITRNQGIIVVASERHKSDKRVSF